MKKHFIHIVVYLLIPCLVADPALANLGPTISEFGSNPNSAIQNPQSNTFASQALAPSLPCAVRPPSDGPTIASKITQETTELIRFPVEVMEARSGLVLSFLEKMNSPLQEIMARAMPAGYPVVCIEASLVAQKILQRQFGDTIQVFYRQGIRKDMTHGWLEVEIGNRLFYLSFTDGQFEMDTELQRLLDMEMYSAFFEQYRARQLDRFVWVEITGRRESFYKSMGITDLNDHPPSSLLQSLIRRCVDQLAIHLGLTHLTYLNYPRNRDRAKTSEPAAPAVKDTTLPELSMPLLRGPLYKVFHSGFGFPSQTAYWWAYHVGLVVEELRQIGWTALAKQLLSASGFGWAIGINALFSLLHLIKRDKGDRVQYGNLPPWASTLVRTLIRTILALAGTAIFVGAQSALPFAPPWLSHYVLPMVISYYAHALYDLVIRLAHMRGKHRWLPSLGEEHQSESLGPPAAPTDPQLGGNEPSEQNRQKAFEQDAAIFERVLHETQTMHDMLEAVRILQPHIIALHERLMETGYRDFHLPSEFLTSTADVLFKDAPQDEIRHMFSVLYQSFLFDYLSFLAVRAGDGGPSNEAANEATVRRLLEEMESPQTPFHTRVVSDVSQLVSFPGSVLSPNEREQVEHQRAFIRIYRGTNGPPRHSRRFVQEESRHLRGLVMQKRIQPCAKHPKLWVEIERTRAANSVDYATTILNQIPLLEYYDQFGNEDGLAIDIAAGLSGDPEMFLNRAMLATLNPEHSKELFLNDTPKQMESFKPGTFYPDDLGQATLDHYFSLLGRVRGRLHTDLSDFEARGPDVVASVFGNMDLYPNVALTQFWMVRLLAPNESEPFIYEDLSRPDTSQARTRWRQLLDDMGSQWKEREPDDSEIQAYIHAFNRPVGLYAFSQLSG